MSRTLTEAVADHASARPDAPALVWNGRTVGFGELYAMAVRARVQLTALAPETEGPLGLRVRKSPEAIALVLGCLLAGRSFLLPSQELPEAPLKELYQQAGCTTVLGLADEGALPADHHLALAGDGGGGQDAGRSDEETAAAALPDRTSPEATGFLLTTSGSTGLPKIVPISRGAVDRFTHWTAETFGFGPRTRVLNYAPLNFDLCLLDIWSTLAAGGTVVLVDPERATSATHLRELVDEHAVTVVQGVSLLFQQLAQSAAERGPLRTPETVIFAGESMPPRLLAELEPALPHARWFNNYGCAETNNSFLYEVDRSQPLPAPLPVGSPLPGVAWLLEGPDGRALTGAGQGELLVSTPFQTTGYLNAPNATKFGPHPDGEPGRIYYRSGDVATRGEDGALRILGRTDFMVKVRGYQISTQSVEDVLLEHPDVVEVAVVALPDPEHGNRLHARLRLAENSTTGGLALRAYCAQHTVRAAVPAVFELVTTPLPRTSSGKVDRTRVRAELLPPTV